MSESTFISPLNSKSKKIFYTHTHTHTSISIDQCLGLITQNLLKHSAYIPTDQSEREGEDLTVPITKLFTTVPKEERRRKVQDETRFIIVDFS
jgi:hypothetical protein